MKPVKGETYLVHAFTCSLAEAAMVENMKHYVSGEFMVTDIRQVKYAEMFFSDADDADKYFKIKLVFVTLDEKTAQEKKQKQDVLVQAADLQGAVNRLREGMKGSMMDYTIAAVTETSYNDIFR